MLRSPSWQMKLRLWYKILNKRDSEMNSEGRSWNELVMTKKECLWNKTEIKRDPELNSGWQNWVRKGE